MPGRAAPWTEPRRAASLTLAPNHTTPHHSTPHALRSRSPLPMHKQTHNQVLERGERLELLVERTEDLAQQTFLFKTDARGLRKRMWWARARVATCVVALLAAAAYGLAAAICGPALHC